MKETANNIRPGNYSDGPLSANGSGCPVCGQRKTPCRSVPLGWYCVVRGLINDTSKWIRPSVEPDPASEDPAVVGAARVANELESVYVAAQQEYERILAEITASGLEVEGVILWRWGSGALIPTRRRDVKRAEALAEQHRQLAQARDRAHEDLVAANTKFRQELLRAKTRHATGE